MLKETIFNCLIISAEFFSEMEIEDYKNISHFFKSEYPEAQIDVYLYTRHPVSYAESGLVQRSKKVAPSEDDPPMKNYINLYERIKNAGLADRISVTGLRTVVTMRLGPCIFS